MEPTVHSERNFYRAPGARPTRTIDLHTSDWRGQMGRAKVAAASYAPAAKQVWHACQLATLVTLAVLELIVFTG